MIRAAACRHHEPTRYKQLCSFFPRASPSVRKLLIELLTDFVPVLLSGSGGPLAKFWLLIESELASLQTAQQINTRDSSLT